MEPKNCITKKSKYTHIKEWERYKIEALLAGKKKPDEIAKLLKRSRSIIKVTGTFINKGDRYIYCGGWIGFDVQVLTAP